MAARFYRTALPAVLVLDDPAPVIDGGHVVWAAAVPAEGARLDRRWLRAPSALVFRRHGRHWVASLETRDRLERGRDGRLQVARFHPDGDTPCVISNDQFEVGELLTAISAFSHVPAGDSIADTERPLDL